MTARPMGIIIAVVAVFETHMETKPEAHMKPSTMRDGDVPMRCTMESAMRRWRPHLCMVCASMKPPRKR